MKTTIFFQCDKEFYYRLKAHKLELEKKREEPLTWNDYIKILFGLAKGDKLK